MCDVAVVVVEQTWRKYGEAERDPPGPNPANTIISEDVFMQFVHNKDSQVTSLDDDKHLFHFIGI